MNQLTKTLVLAGLLAFGFTAGAAQAADSMMHKHPFECAACHKTGMGQPVQADQCRSCHSNIHDKPAILENGEANPHRSIHYAPETVDCGVCHHEHKKSGNYYVVCHADGLGFKVP